MNTYVYMYTCVYIYTYIYIGRLPTHGKSSHKCSFCEAAEESIEDNTSQMCISDAEGEEAQALMLSVGHGGIHCRTCLRHD